MYFTIQHRILLLIFLGTAPLIQAQTATDGLLMSRGNVCAALMYTQGSWNQYWEGTNFRKNPNLGTVTTQTMSVMGALGITDNLNLIAALPYVRTGASASYLQGQQGLQDVSVWLKYRFLKKNIPFGTLSTFVTGGISAPVSKYVPDFLPLSIGLQSKTASGRLVVDYLTKAGWYVTAQGGYTRRSNIHIDRDAYLYDKQLYYTNEVQVPDVVDGGVQVGFRNKRFQTDIRLERFAALSGDDIRYNDAPFPSNAMKATSIGWYGRYNIRDFSAIASLNYVTDGRNVGQTSSFSVGVLYTISVFAHGKKCEKPGADTQKSTPE